MVEAVGIPRLVRFATFEADLAAGELRKSGLKLKLTGQPFQVLAILLEHPGEVVTREELQKRLWPDTFVDADHNLNTAINKIREALGDSAETPRFVETLPRRGYRFVAPVEVLRTWDQEQNITKQGTPGNTDLTPTGRKPGFGPRALIAVATMIVALTIGWYRYKHRNPATEQIRAIAVLPLENLSGDPSQEYFADGMTEALINDLSRISALRVISRTTMMQYKTARKPLPEIARELKVDAIMEGAVQRSGDRVRITAQLIDGTRDANLWSRTFDRQLEDALVLQSEIAQAVATEIRVELTTAGSAEGPAIRSVNPEAHDTYLRARYLASKKTKDALEQSIALYQQAIGEDPQFAPAYAGMADAYIVLESQGQMPATEANPRIRAAAMSAVQADSNLAEAHLILADVRETEWDWAGAELEYKRAIELNPGLARAHHWYAILLSTLKRHDQAISEIERAVDLEPLIPSLYLVQSGTYYLAGHYDQALQILNSSPVLNTNSAGVSCASALAYLRKGDYAQAVSEAQAAVASEPEDSSNLALLGYVYAVAGRRKEALVTVDELTRLGKTKYIEPGWMAMIWIALGANDQAFDLLEQDYQLHSSFVMSLTNPAFEPLRPDRRFQDLLHRVGLP